MSEPASTIIRLAGRQDPFARIPRTLLDDPSLSWAAKGVLSYILSKPDGWRVQVGDLLKRSTDGKHAARAAIRELRDAGYAKLVQERSGGRVTSWTLHVSDSALFPAVKPIPSLDPEKQDLEILDPENQHHSKNDLSKNDLSKNDLSKNDLSLQKEESNQVQAIETMGGSKRIKQESQPVLLDAPSRKRFTPPSLDEVRSYLEQQGSNGASSSLAEGFLNHHTARGWVLGGGRKMVDWQAAARTWRDNAAKFSGPPRKSVPVDANAASKWGV